MRRGTQQPGQHRDQRGGVILVGVDPTRRNKAHQVAGAARRAQLRHQIGERGELADRSVVDRITDAARVTQREPRAIGEQRRAVEDARTPDRLVGGGDALGRLGLHAARAPAQALRQLGLLRDHDIGLEWQQSNFFEITGQYTFADRRYEDAGRLNNRQQGQLFRIQFQVNY